MGIKEEIEQCLRLLPFVINFILYSSFGNFGFLSSWVSFFFCLAGIEWHVAVGGWSASWPESFRTFKKGQVLVSDVKNGKI